MDIISEGGGLFKAGRAKDHRAENDVEGTGEEIDFGH